MTTVNAGTRTLGRRWGVGLACASLIAFSVAVSTGPAASQPGAVSAASHGPGPEQLGLVGRSDLGGGGRNANVAVVGTTAVVGAGILSSGFHARWYTPMSCPDVSVKVVDLSNPAAPRVAATIPLAPGVISIDVAAIRVTTPAFTGDLAALALQACDQRGGAAERGVAYYDVSNPASPQFLGRYQADADNVPAVLRPATAPRPAPVAPPPSTRWTSPSGPTAGCCRCRPSPAPRPRTSPPVTFASWT